MFHRPAALLAALFCALFAPPTFAESYRLESRRATFVLPDGWKAMDAGELAEINGLMKSRAQDSHYEAGFRPAGTEAGSTPYALISFQPRNGGVPSYAAIERDLSKGAQTKAKMKEIKRDFSDTFKDLSVGSATLDRENNRVLMRLNITGNNGVEMTCVSVGHLQSTGICFVHSYCLTPELDQVLPTFSRLNDSMKVDPGFEYTPPDLAIGILYIVMTGGMVCVLVGCLVFAMLKLQKPRSAITDEAGRPDGLTTL